jgi:hypothetical protein
MRAMRMAFLIFGFAAALVAPAVAAEKYPSRPVHFVTGFAAGGPVDIVALGAAQRPSPGKPHRRPALDAKYLTFRATSAARASRPLS